MQNGKKIKIKVVKGGAFNSKSGTNSFPTGFFDATLDILFELETFAL